MDWDTFARLWRWGNAVSAVGVLQFAVCLAAAMLVYPGGTPLESNAPGYSFFGNYLSDLGRSVAWSGVPNPLGSILFNTSLMVLGLATIPFFLFLPLHVPDRAPALWCAAGFGLLSSLGLIGVGLTPYDKYLNEHLTALFLWIVPFLAALAIHFFVIMGSKECSPLFPLLSLGLAVLIALYLVRTLAYGLPPQAADNGASLLKSIALQKYVLFASLGWYLVFSARMLLTVDVKLPERDSGLDQEAEGYLRRLQGRK